MQENGNITAFCYADKINASIWVLFVHPGHEGQGLGCTLLGLAADWLFSLDHDTVQLRTGARTSTDRFFAKQGWRCTTVNAGNIRYTFARVDRTR